jgi:hypothetical protein
MNDLGCEEPQGKLRSRCRFLTIMFWQGTPDYDEYFCRSSFRQNTQPFLPVLYRGPLTTLLRTGSLWRIMSVIVRQIEINKNEDKNSPEIMKATYFAWYATYKECESRNDGIALDRRRRYDCVGRNPRNDIRLPGEAVKGRSWP